MLWLGVDVGGTFTDLVLFDATAGTLQVLKTPSTPRNQSEGILAGINQLGLDAKKLGRMVHGTTVATNTALERDGARLASPGDRGAQGRAGRGARQPHGHVQYQGRRRYARSFRGRNASRLTSDCASTARS